MDFFTREPFDYEEPFLMGERIYDVASYRWFSVNFRDMMALLFTVLLRITNTCSLRILLALGFRFSAMALFWLQTTMTGYLLPAIRYTFEYAHACD